MIEDQSLLNALSNEHSAEEKQKHLQAYKTKWQADGYEKGWTGHENLMKCSHMKRKQSLRDKASKLIDQIRDLIWQRKQELEKVK